jgi:hypothetical protein
MPALSWLIRPILIVAAGIAGWFVAEEAPNFSVVQMVVSVFLIAALVGLAAFWEALMELWRERDKDRS